MYLSHDPYMEKRGTTMGRGIGNGQELDQLHSQVVEGRPKPGNRGCELGSRPIQAHLKYAVSSETDEPVGIAEIREG